MVFSSHDMKHCELMENSLCLIPRYTRQHSPRLQCMMGLFKGRPVREISQTCEFKCWSNQELNIDQLGDTLYITNAKSVRSECRNDVKDYNTVDIGSTELRMVCGCKLIVDGMEINAPLHCDRADFTIHVTIPTVWSSVGDGEGNRYTSHESIFDSNWTR
jgi:hypothetical protein